MDKIDKMLEQAKLALNDYVKQFELLEKEKKKIISLYKKATQKDRTILEEKMKESEAKYKKLCEEIMLFSLKVKKLKKQCC